MLLGFNQQLLCTLPCRSEKELLGKFRSYRAHYLYLNPDIESAIEASSSSHKAQPSFISQLYSTFT